MDLLTTNRVIVLASFLGVLGLAYILARLSPWRPSNSSSQSQRLRHKEQVPLGPEARASLVEVDDQKVLVVVSRKGEVSIQILGGAL